ncbi:MAG: NAD(+) synthase [Clostridia bacterium]|nr:NAD(+) synthase [Clostridia bacterium]
MKYGFIKVGAMTPDMRVADIAFNAEMIIKGINEAKNSGVSVLVFPELSICGYTAQDLMLMPRLLDASKEALEKIVAASKKVDMLIFVGMPLFSNGLVYNVCVAINHGKILGVVPKKYIKNSCDSYEGRVFSSCGKKTENITLLSDTVPFGTDIIFFANGYEKLMISAEIANDMTSLCPPSFEHAKNGANLIVNLSNMGQTVGADEYRKKAVSYISSVCCCGYVYCESGKDESTTDGVFAGHNVIAENGKIIKESQIFENGLTASEIDIDFLNFERSKMQNYNYEKKDYTYIGFDIGIASTKLTRKFDKLPFLPSENTRDRAEEIMQIQAQALAKRIRHTNTKKLVLGLSGGLDSTLALIVAAHSAKLCSLSPSDIITCTMPCFGTTNRTYQNTIRLAKAFGTTLREINIANSVKSHFEDIGHDIANADVTFENAQARERTQVLMDIANEVGGLVIGTGDLSEIALGWSTYNGDHMAMYSVNCDVPKTLIRYIVKAFADKSNKELSDVLTDVLNTPVSPELLPDKGGKIAQKTEDIVGPYELHDFFLWAFIRRGYSPKKIFYVCKYTFGDDYSDETIIKWLRVFHRRFFAQQFKRSCAPDGVKVGSVALSARGDLKMPSDAQSATWLAEIDELEKEI